MMDPPSSKRSRAVEDPGQGDDGAPNAPRSPKRRKHARIDRLDADDQQQGQLLATDTDRWYGFVESVSLHDAPVRVHRAHRGSPAGAALPGPQRVSVVFDCLSADWFDNQVPDDLNIAWDTVAMVAYSCRAELLIDLGYFNLLNQRLHPVTAWPLPHIAEGTWWELRLATVIPPPNLAVMLTLPDSPNPVSTILSARRVLAELTDLTVPRQLMKLRRFSHGWGIFGPGPDDPPYPGR